jgi:hypothetical protein
MSHKRPQGTYKAALQVARKLYFDTSKATVELGLPRTPLSTTMERAVGWFREHGYHNM